MKANAMCRERGGDIVSIHSAEENNFIGSLAEVLLKKCLENNECMQRKVLDNSNATFVGKLIF